MATPIRKRKWTLVLLAVILLVLISVAALIGVLRKDSTEQEPTTQPTTQATTQPEPSETTVPTTRPVETTQPTTQPAETTIPTTQPEETTQPTTEPMETTPPTTQPVETTPPTTEPDEGAAVTPDYGEYINVGYGYIAEIINYSAETFNGKTKDDYTAPIRNYLPAGTVDYASTKIVSNSTMDYVLLRCGRRVYLEKSNKPSTTKVPVVECYYGTLPDHNEVGFADMFREDHYTILTLDVLWKAPFYFDILPQEYNAPSHRDYTIDSFTAEYIDITFCYATVFEGEVQIPEDDKLFASAKVIQNESDCTLRLYLKKTGGFYGYDSYYNEAGQLCFKFLNPVSASKTSENRYGADLSGIRIFIDVGHGGLDGGKSVKYDGKSVEEADLNLKVAKALQKELESMGATVILNRTDDSRINADDRVRQFKEANADLCIAIHHNSDSGVGTAKGLLVCYSTPMSHNIAQLMYKKNVNAGIYRANVIDWHYYFVAKQTDCPVVLMECGFMSNTKDLEDMLSSSITEKKAVAMAEAVATYFLKLK